jgi:phage-related tail fiber protein
MGGNIITGVGTPANPTDAANKGYVDNALAGLSWKEAVRVASAANFGSLSGLLSVDGVTVAVGDRVLVKDQTTTTANGIYVAASGAWARATDADSQFELEGMAVFVMEGNTLADTAWVCTTNAPITVGSTGLTFAQFAGGAGVVAGTGLTSSGNIINVIGDASILTPADNISRAALTGDVTAAAGANA